MPGGRRILALHFERQKCARASRISISTRSVSECFSEGGSNPSWIEQVAESPPDDADPQNSAVDRLFNRALELVRSEFESRTWQAYWRVTVDGDRPADVAIDLKMSVAAVYMAKSRVFRRVRTELSGLFD